MTLSIKGAGDLRHALVIRRQAAGYDAHGQANGADENVARVRGEVKTLSGQEQQFARTLYAEASLQVTIRYFPDLTSEYWLVLAERRRERELTIGHIDNVDQRNEWHVLLCSERV